MTEPIKIDGVWGSFDFATGIHLPQKSAGRSKAEIVAEVEAKKNATLQKKARAEFLHRYFAKLDEDLAKDLRHATENLRLARETYLDDSGTS